MKRILTTMTAAAGVCALLGSAAAAQQDSSPPSSQAPAAESRSDQAPSKAARSFIEDAAADSTAEVKLGKLAQDKASDDDVKAFAERMVEDHSKANERLTQVASRHNVTPPQELKTKHQKTFDQLSKLSGDEFDREYIKHMVKDHEKAVKLFRKQANRSDGEVSQFASATLPTLEEHLAEAKRIRQGLRDDVRGTSGTRDTTGTTGSSGIEDNDPVNPGGDDIDDPPHSEPPPSSPTPDPSQRP